MGARAVSPLLQTVPRADFINAVNTELTEEPYVTCQECGRKHHEICQLWFKGMAKKFVCKFCRRDLGPEVSAAAHTH
jgi:transcription elongation factor Elf1